MSQKMNETERSGWKKKKVKSSCPFCVRRSSELCTSTTNGGKNSKKLSTFSEKNHDRSDRDRVRTRSMKSPKAHLLDGFCSVDGTDAIKLSYKMPEQPTLKNCPKKICLILSLFLSSFLSK